MSHAISRKFNSKVNEGGAIEVFHVFVFVTDTRIYSIVMIADMETWVTPSQYMTL